MSKSKADEAALLHDAEEDGVCIELVRKRQWGRVLGRGKEPDQLEGADDVEEEEDGQDGDQQQEGSSDHLFYAFSIDF